MSGLKAKVCDAIHFVSPDHRDVIINVLNRHGKDMNGITINDMINTMREGMSKDELLALVYLSNWDRNRYAPKLTIEQRCEVLALYMTGFSQETIGAMYGINRRTVTHICKPNGVHYKQIRESAASMGKEAFVNKYMAHDKLTVALAFRQDREDTAQKNNKFAAGKDGIHIVRGENCVDQHRVIIQWREEEGGWFYRDLDGDFPDRWFCSQDETSCRTSQSCYIFMLKDITDRLPI